MRRRLWVLPLMYLMVMMSLGTIHAGEASSEAEVGFDVNEDSVYTGDRKRCRSGRKTVYPNKPDL